MSRCRAGIVALLLGCGGGADDDATSRSPESETSVPSSTCIADNPPVDPFDMGDTENFRATPAPEPGGEPIRVPPLTPTDIAQFCSNGGGTGCDTRAFISRAAADCIAGASGLEAGVRPWSTSLNYYDNHQRVGWGIMTVREYTADGYGGDSLVLDATTGEELARSSYSAIVN